MKGRSSNEFSIDPSASIRAGSIKIGRKSTICKDVVITCPGSFEIGPCSYIGPGTCISCWDFKAGSYLFLEERVEIGMGGCLQGPDSTVTMGNMVFCGVDVIINPSKPVSIGNGCGIGCRAAIWTHGAWNSILDGYPAAFAPVTIGKNVWLTGCSNVLPGITIGDGAVVGMMSLVNKDLPTGCLAGGVPVKVLKRDCYPKKLSGEEQGIILDKLLEEYRNDAHSRGLHPFVKRDGSRLLIDRVLLDTISLTESGESTELSEDLRDYLRRHGVRILTGKPFRRIQHPVLRNLLEEQ